MACEPVFTQGKLTGWICRRGGGPPKDAKCSICGSPATCVCDYRDGGVREARDECGRVRRFPWFSLTTCDRPLCASCATHVESGMDFCPHHSNELAIFRTKKANAYYHAELRRLGLDDEE